MLLNYLIKKMLKNIIVLGVSLLYSISASAQFENCSEFFYKNNPLKIQLENKAELCFSEFAVLYSGAVKSPLAVAEVMNQERLKQAKKVGREDNFYEEARLPAAWRSKLSSYKGSGFDRGHLAPAANMPSEEGMAQSFSLANMVAQDPQNNRKIWSKIEEDTRKYISRAKGNVYIITGPAFLSNRGKLPAGEYIPSHLYKLVIDEADNRAWAMWVENSATAKPERISYEELSHRLGINLVP